MTLKSRPMRKNRRRWLLFSALLILLSGPILFDLVSQIFEFPVVAFRALTLSSITTIPIFFFLWWLDRHEPEPLSMILVAFLWGALVATSLSVLFNTAFVLALESHQFSAEQAELVTSMLSAPIIEEITKAMALFLIYALFYEELDNRLDGLIYGGMIGLGFAWFENTTYYITPFIKSGDSASLYELARMFYSRGIMATLGGSHVSYTALSGAAFGLFREKKYGIIILPIGVGVAILAHFIWNAFAPYIASLFGQGLLSYLVGLPCAVLLLQAPLLLYLSTIIKESWNQESLLIWTNLKEEKRNILTLPELQRFKNGCRVFHPLIFLASEQKRLHNELQHLHVRLAFSKWQHCEDPKATWSIDLDEDVVFLRNKIKILRSLLRKTS